MANEFNHMFHFIMYPNSDLADAANCIEELQKRLAKAEIRLNSLERELGKLKPKEAESR
jgi:hypothetical protein